MELFNNKVEKLVGISFTISIPLLIFNLWLMTGEIGQFEITIVIITLLMGIGIMNFMKWYTNKK